MLTPGTQLGPYRIEALLGAGGMGEVYRAHDPRLGRDVALKVLPPAFVSDTDRQLRFAREARALAALSHPHIGSIYGFEETDSARAIVLELVEGETLAERLRPQALPVDEAITFARQMSEALEAAHEKGIVHRDLKPANIKVTPDGKIKLLDFGLAKALETATDSAAGETPTLTSGGTKAGTVLGSPAYMSPEQARGQVVDKRTDIWAFGCVLYEMLSGKRAFVGETTSDTIAAILNQEPDWGALPASIPVYIRVLLQRCLEKDRKRRLRDIGDAAIELERPAASAASPSPAVAFAWRRGGGLIVSLALGVILVGIAIVAWKGRPAPSASAPVRLTAALPRGVSVTTGPAFASSLALSPDGRTLIIAGTGETGLQLYQRRLDQLQASPLAGTAAGVSPFLSPDGRWIGFFAEGRLRKIPTDGGTPVDITTVPLHTYGASWGPDDQIVLVWGARSQLYSVSAGGGTAEPITTLESDEPGHYRPEVLPDGRGVLFDDGTWIHGLDRRNGRRVRLLQGLTPRYSPSGHLIFSRGTTLLAAPFDPIALKVTGAVVPLAENVGNASFALSSSGSLAYVPASAGFSLVLLSKNAAEQRLMEERLTFENPQFSPDGRRIAVASRRRSGERLEIWVQDLAQNAASRLTSDGGRAPVWTPDGSAITYSHLGDQQGIYLKSADGSGAPRRLIALDEFHWLIGWTPDGKTLAYGSMLGTEAHSLSTIWAFSGGEARQVMEPGPIWGGRLSPDGRWLAFYGMEGGRFEVYVTPFPEGGARWLISENGGQDPTWSPDGKEVLYRYLDRLIAARVDLANGGRVLSRRVVVEPFRLPLFDDYDIHPDGRIVMVRDATDSTSQVVLVMNFHAELERLLASQPRGKD